MSHRAVELGSTEFWERLASAPERLGAEVCMVDMANLEQTLQHHASLRAWVNAVHEVAETEYAAAKWELTKTEALVLLRLRAETDTIGQLVKRTDKVLQAETEASPEVAEANQAVLQAARKRGALRAMASALEDRKDMLIQISASRRKENAEYR